MHYAVAVHLNYFTLYFAYFVADNDHDFQGPVGTRSAFWGSDFQRRLQNDSMQVHYDNITI